MSFNPLDATCPNPACKESLEHLIVIERYPADSGPGWRDPAYVALEAAPDTCPTCGTRIQAVIEPARGLVIYWLDEEAWEEARQARILEECRAGEAHVLAEIVGGC